MLPPGGACKPVVDVVKSVFPAASEMMYIRKFRQVYRTKVSNLSDATRRRVKRILFMSVMNVPHHVHHPIRGSAAVWVCGCQCWGGVCVCVCLSVCVSVCLCVSAVRAGVQIIRRDCALFRLAPHHLRPIVNFHKVNNNLQSSVHTDTLYF